MALPNVIVIGAMKAGTYSLHNYLHMHPAIEMSQRRKELNFFVAEMNWRRGRAWYESHFIGDTPLRGESSTRYSMCHRYAGVPARMHDLLPDAKLIYMVRDPVRRLISAWRHNVDDRKESRDFEAVLAAPDRDRYLNTGLYHAQLQAYLAHYDAGAIRVVCFEDLVADPRPVMRGLFAFLGVDPDYSDPRWGEVFNASDDKRRETAAGRAVRALVGRRRLRRTAWLRETFTRPIPKPVFDARRHADIVARYREDTCALAEFCGRDFPAWQSLRG